MIFSKKGNNLFQVSIRSLFLRLEENKEIQCILEEGFIFLTERLKMIKLESIYSDVFANFYWIFIVSNLQVWFLEKPKADVCWGRGESNPEDVDDGGHTNQNEEGPGQDCLFHYQAEHMKFFIYTLKSHTHTTQVFNHNDYLPVLKLESRVSINNFWAR